MTLFAGTRADTGHVDGQDQAGISQRFSPFDQVKGDLFRLSDVELKPGVFPRALGRLLDAARCHGRKPQGYSVMPGRPGKHRVGTRPGQVAHAHRRNAERQVPGLPEKGLA